MTEANDARRFFCNSEKKRRFIFVFDTPKRHYYYYGDDFTADNRWFACVYSFRSHSHFPLSQYNLSGDLADGRKNPTTGQQEIIRAADYAYRVPNVFIVIALSSSRFPCVFFLENQNILFHFRRSAAVITT